MLPLGPRPYRPEFDERIVELGAQGFSLAEMAVGIGVNMGEFEGMRATQPSFDEAVGRAQMASWEWWMARLAMMVRNQDMARAWWPAWMAGVRTRFGTRALRTMEWPPPDPPARAPRRQSRTWYDYRRIGR